MTHPEVCDNEAELKKTILQEIAIFEQCAGKLPIGQNSQMFNDLGALWVVSGGGSYLCEIIDTSSDNKNIGNSWYLGQDKDRLDYAKLWLDALPKKQKSDLPVLIYNGTFQQNADLLKAIEDKIFDLPKSRLYIAPGKITRTIEQVQGFSFPPGFSPQGKKLAVLSHTAHLPRILRFMNKFPKPFKGIEVVVLGLNVQNHAGQRAMVRSEVKNLLRYIARGEAAAEPYPFDKYSQGSVDVLPVTSSDLMDIFELSNQDSVRAVSFTPEKIKLEDHRKWFSRKLADKNIIILKATIEGSLAGQVRLDLENDEALISISTSEYFRGMGVASKMLQSAIAEAKKRGLKTINAFIKPDNQTSIRLFEKNGWIYAGQEKESGVIANKYIYKTKKGNE